MFTIGDGIDPLRSECPIVVTAHPPPDLALIGLISTPEIITCALTKPAVSGYTLSGGDMVDIRMHPSSSSLQEEQRMKSLGHVGHIGL